MLKDSGDRREFPSGAVRDLSAGKGRCDLLPIGVLAEMCMNIEAKTILKEIDMFQRDLDTKHLNSAIVSFGVLRKWDFYTLMLELSIHLEEGAIKYGERNWEKGLPVHCYIDSGVRHLLKFLRGDEDEPHDRAFVWNLAACIYTIQNRPECIDIAPLT